jgi:S-adenosylmethionine-diacylgycerolhomoserine-N-methlytransferase
MSKATTITNTSISQYPLSMEQPTQAQKMSAYYRFHAKIYDLTRWTFLFGRHWLLDWLPFNRTEKFSLLEIGCGTGHNLKYLVQNFPKATLMGIDTSPHMLQIAQNKLEDMYNKPLLVQALYGTTQESAVLKNTQPMEQKPNIVLFSYCLSMVNPSWEKLIVQAHEDLCDGGYIAIVDFHNSRYPFFKKWMSFNHVRMDGHILPFLKDNFNTVKCEVRRAYFGLWHYTLYIGKK